jgi:hypothetical protein
MPITSLYVQPLTALQALIASSGTFQGIVGEIDAAHALNHIYFQETDDTLDGSAPADAPNYVNSLPRAIVYLEKGTRAFRIGPGNWKFPTRLSCAFQFLVPDNVHGTSFNEAEWFLTVVEEILEDMTNNSGLSDADGNPYLDATSFTITNGPMPCDQDFSPMYFWGIDFLVETPS